MYIRISTTNRKAEWICAGKLPHTFTSHFRVLEFLCRVRRCTPELVQIQEISFLDLFHFWCSWHSSGSSLLPQCMCTLRSAWPVVTQHNLTVILSTERDLLVSRPPFRLLNKSGIVTNYSMSPNYGPTSISLTVIYNMTGWHVAR